MGRYLDFVTGMIEGEPARDWQIDFGRLSGAKGETVRSEVPLQLFFRGDRLLVDGPAKITGVFVGARSVDFSSSDKPVWPLGLVGQTVSVVVEFLEDGAWYATLFGKGWLP